VHSTGRRPRNLPANVKPLLTVTLQGERPRNAPPVFRHLFWSSHFPGRFLGRGSTAASQLREIHGAAWQRYGGDPEAAEKLLAVGQSPRDNALDPAELAAWTTVTSILLNLDETITRQ
jgi:hypothetical protein